MAIKAIVREFLEPRRTDLRSQREALFDPQSTEFGGVSLLMPRYKNNGCK